ncbi:MAG TPA: hypothetical protein DCY12_02410 [Candidatus Atribacteria bacterium]|nr:hypothetical protein [Candidatus Atribacteria bacterium]
MNRMMMNRKIIVYFFTALVVACSLIFPNHSSATTPLVESSEERECLECHRASNSASVEGAFNNREFCKDCHSNPERSIKTVGNNKIQLIFPADALMDYPHKFLACTACHVDAARSPHKSLSGAQCLDCHSFHGEGTSHSPHLTVACQACHWEKGLVKMDADKGQVMLSNLDKAGNPVPLTEHRLADLKDMASCERCHNKENTVFAPASVLPPKGIVCLACHPSSMAIGHFTFGISLLVFFLGIIFLFYFYFQGKVLGESESLSRKLDLSSELLWKTLFSKKFFKLLRVFFIDIVLQTRILKESVSRWLLHSFIFYSILLRFFLSAVTGIIFWIFPDSSIALALINKSHPFVAFIYDFLGLLIIIGIIASAIQRFLLHPAHIKTEYVDSYVLILLAALIIFGFITEAVRLLTTGLSTEVAAWSFIGYPLSLVLKPFNAEWKEIYPTLWYVHAVIGALFIASIPFGKLKHIISTPLTYFIEEIDGVKR